MELFQNKIFSAGFFITAIIIFLLKQIEFVKEKTGSAIYETSSGFPFAYQRTKHTMFSATPEVMPLGLLADVLIGVVACFVGALLCQSIAESFAHHRKIKQIKAEAKTIR